MTFLLRFLPFFLISHQALATIWLVGPTRVYNKPSQVSSLVQQGDSVFIDAGIYPNDVARWTANNLLFRGMGGLAHLKSGGNVYGGKAIWVIVGNDVVVENIEFSEAACPDLNGAGIRSEGINLQVRHCYFHDNENGILAGDIASGDFLIEHCEFRGNGYANGLAHNLYINHANSLIFRYNYSHDAKVGHELKSRAYQNYIYCNRFSDEMGTASRNIDLPNGGFSILVGNLIVQDQFSENNNLVGYGLEGLSNPNNELYVAFNTFVNNKNVGSFIHVANGTPHLKAYNNIFAGPGNLIVGAALQLDTLANRAAPLSAFHFANPAGYDFNLETGSVANHIAVDAGTAGNFPLNPSVAYLHPNNFQTRSNTHDAGAFMGPISSGNPVLTTQQVRLYPNPANEWLAVAGIEAASEKIVLDIFGKTYCKTSNSNQLNISDLPPGFYLLQCSLNPNIITLPFVKK